MTIAVQSDILASLGTLRNQVEHQLAGVSRYRAMVTIEKTIAELSEFSDLTKPLSEIRDTIQAQLSETREYRALRTVERIAPELAEVLASLDDGEAQQAKLSQKGRYVRHCRRSAMRSRLPHRRPAQMRDAQMKALP